MGCYKSTHGSGAKEGVREFTPQLFGKSSGPGTKGISEIHLNAYV